jgi:AcrR family transcriptional regulator
VFGNDEVLDTHNNVMYIEGMNEAESRRRILEAARDLFLQRGYRGATLRSIADGAGVTTGALYHHFQGKDELFVEVCLQGLDLLGQRFGTALELTAGRPRAERVMALFDAYAAHFLEERGYFLLIERLQTTPQAELPIEPSLARRVEKASRRLLAQMTELIRSSDVEESTESQTEAQQKMLLLVSFAEGIFSCERRGLLKRYGVELAELRAMLLDRVEGLLE